MLQIYSTVYYYTLKKLNSYAYITKTYHKGKPLPIVTFVLKRHFAHVHFPDKLEQLWTGPYKIVDRLSDVTLELLAQDGSTLHVQRIHLIPYYPNEPLLYPHLCLFMRFADSINFDINTPKPKKKLTVTHYLLIPMNPSLTILLHQMTKTLHKMTSFKTHQILILRQILPHLSNKSSKLLIMISFLTDPVTHLKTNQHLPILQIKEIPKLIIT